MIYKANTDEMQEYASLINALTRADIERERCVAMISQWEKAHGIEDENPDEQAPEQ